MSFTGICRECKKEKTLFHFNELCYKCWDKETILISNTGEQVAGMSCMGIKMEDYIK